MITFKGIPLAYLSKSLRAARVGYFDGTGKWKLDADGKIELKDGNPVWITATGVEQTVGGDTITRLNGEAMSHRTRAEAAEAKLKDFEGVDPVKAKEALTTVGKLKQGELIAAGKVDEVRDEVTKSFQSKIDEANAKAATTEARLHGVLVATAFGQSKFIADKLAIPADIAQATFGGRFKVEGDKVVAYDESGAKPIYSTTRAGELATFDEALDTIVGTYANKDRILKGANSTGSGNTGAGGVGPGGIRIVRRAEFNAMTPQDQAKTGADAGAGKVKIED